ncbi:hypothetical protein BC332_30471 [Capsicum chinense]|nr:hypothetical protein BC332_30471 [Capsicum chinense]
MMKGVKNTTTTLRITTISVSNSTTTKPSNRPRFRKQQHPNRPYLVHITNFNTFNLRFGHFLVLAATASTLNVVCMVGRGRGIVGVAGRGRGTVGVAERGRGTVGVAGRGTGIVVIFGRGRGTIGVAGRGREIVGVAERGRKTSVAAISNVGGVAGRGSGKTFKRPRLVGMGVLHTQSAFTIHNVG